jgi:hypothetical protein
MKKVHTHTSGTPPCFVVRILRTTSTLWSVPNGMKADRKPAAVALSARPPTYTTLLDVMAVPAASCTLFCDMARGAGGASEEKEEAMVVVGVKRAAAVGRCPRIGERRAT